MISLSCILQSHRLTYMYMLVHKYLIHAQSTRLVLHKVQHFENSDVIEHSSLSTQDCPMLHTTPDLHVAVSPYYNNKELRDKPHSHFSAVWSNSCDGFHHLLHWSILDSLTVHLQNSITWKQPWEEERASIPFLSLTTILLLPPSPSPAVTIQ